MLALLPLYLVVVLVVVLLLVALARTAYEQGRTLRHRRDAARRRAARGGYVL